MYKVKPFGKKWVIVLGDSPDARPIGEQLYTQKTHAYRHRRKLIAKAQKIDKMIEKDGAIII